jgi:DNA polymerase III subunit epsilon
MKTLSFTALDFETATPEHNSICQVGFVVVNQGIIERKFSFLIKPPGNKYFYQNIKVHKIEPFMTDNSPNFKSIWNEIEKYFVDKHIVCHNADFDLLKLEETLKFYDFPIPNYTFSCTLKIFGEGLEACCKKQNIEFINHHDALSDAEACAKLYFKYLESNGEIFIKKDDTPFAAKKIEKDDLRPNFDIDNKDNPFYQKRVVFTGDLITYSRKEAAHKIKLLGADVNTSLSRKTDFVVIGRHPGPSKMEKIAKLNIPTFSEDDFLEMLN